MAKLSIPFLFITLLMHHPLSHSYSREALLFHGKHKELGKWGGRQLGFTCPLQTLQQAQSTSICLIRPQPDIPGCTGSGGCVTRVLGKQLVVSSEPLDFLKGLHPISYISSTVLGSTEGTPHDSSIEFNQRVTKPLPNQGHG